MKRKNRIRVLCITLVILFHSMPSVAYAGMYTYIYDYWGDERESPDAYTVQTLITGDKLGIGNFLEPQGLFVRDNRIYVCDTGNSRIVVLERNQTDISVVDVFNTFHADIELNYFSGPQDVFVAKNGDYYICDTRNQRVVHLNAEKELIKEVVRPNDETVDAKSDFHPTKIVVNDAGRMYVLVRNYNKGLVQYDDDGNFAGYMGANEVKFSMTDYLWKLVSTEAQQSQMESFVPTEYNNLALDPDGFIYATTSVFDENELESDKAKPIRRLNAMGKDILIKNGEWPPIGDLWWGTAGGVGGASKFVDITALDNDTYYAIDRTRGRIFGYDSQGNLLYAFGGLGNKQGYFQLPTALEHMGYDLLVLDSKSSAITIFTLTQFGELVNRAISEYQKGNYDISSDYWEEVLMQNGNYDLAYIGIGRSLLRKGEYKQAMEYFELKKDYNNYSKAFKLYRKVWIEENIGWIFAVLVGAIVLSKGVKTVKTIRKEAREYEAG